MRGRVVGAVLLAIAWIGVALILRQALVPAPEAGPLALIEPTVGTSDSRSPGKLEITDDCVRLISPDGSGSIVIWWSGSVTWDPINRSIVVTNPAGDVVSLRNGDGVALGGAGGPAATIESAGSWVRRPAEACTDSEWFIATEVRLDAGG